MLGQSVYDSLDADFLQTNIIFVKVIVCSGRFHNFNSHNFKLGVLNARTIAYCHFNMPFESLNLRGPGPNLPD